MTTEPIISNIKWEEKRGWIEVITGCMFSGKTEELIRRLNRAIIARQKVEIFKPKIDNRYHEYNIVTHDLKEIRSTPVEFSSDILMLAENCHVVGIDEAQFFDEDIAQVSNTLAKKGKRVIVAGLDMDYLGSPFQNMANLLTTAEFITKMQAICLKCGNPANYTYRKVKSDKRFLVGEKDIYEPRCRKCFYSYSCE